MRRANDRTGRTTERELPRGVGPVGAVALSWTIAGGVTLGGFVVAVLTLGERLSGSGLLLTSGVLFVIGAALGYLHGGMLGLLGRPAGVTRQEAFGGLGMAALYAVPLLLVSWIATGWIAMTVVALYVGKVLALVGTALGWLVGVVLVGTAAVHGWRALQEAYARWAERRAGTLLVMATMGALLVSFLADRPMIWGMHLRVTEVGAVLLAVAATLWIAGPMITLGLYLMRRVRVTDRAFATGGRSRALVDIAAGLVVGVLLGALALPFHLAPYAAPTALAAGGGTAGALVVAFSNAIVDEVLLRLFAVTAIVWALLRWHDVHKQEAAIAAIIVAAIAQVALYVPGAIAIGFPSLLATTGYLLVGVLVPALAFGALFWKRGLGAALVAHAAAVIALALIAG